MDIGTFSSIRFKSMSIQFRSTLMNFKAILELSNFLIFHLQPLMDINENLIKWSINHKVWILNINSRCCDSFVILFFDICQVEGLKFIIMSSISIGNGIKIIKIHHENGGSVKTTNRKILDIFGPYNRLFETNIEDLVDKFEHLGFRTRAEIAQLVPKFWSGPDRIFHMWPQGGT